MTRLNRFHSVFGLAILVAGSIPAFSQQPGRGGGATGTTTVPGGPGVTPPGTTPPGSGNIPRNDRTGGGLGGASRGGGFSERDLMGCEIRAALPGFRSDVVNLSGRRAFDNPDVGTIVLHRLANVEGVTISAVSLQAPKDAKKAY